MIQNATLSAEMFSEHARTRAATLTELIKLLRGFPEDGTRETFSCLFARAQSVLELDDVALARLFRVSRPTIGRWARGESAPHPIGRGAVFESFVDVARTKLRHYSAEPGASHAKQPVDRALAATA